MFRVRTDGDPDDNDNTPNETPYLEILGLDGSGDDWSMDSRLDTPLVTGQWYHAAAVYNGRTTDLYLDRGNGYRWQNGSTMKTSGWFSSTDDWVIGRGAWDGSPVDWLDGQVDEVRISNASLSQQQFLHNDTDHFADLVNYTIDPTESSLTISGNIAGFDLFGQGDDPTDPNNPGPNPATLTTALGGNVTAHLNGNTLTFDDLSDLDLQPNPSAPFEPALGSTVTWWDPDAQGGAGETITTTFPSTGEENLAFDITPGLESIDVAALRDVFLGISWGTADFDGPVTGIEIRTKMARFDFHSEFQEAVGETGAGSSLEGGAGIPNVATGTMTRTDDGTTETITIPFKMELPDSFEGIVFEGQIVATRSLVEATPGDFDLDGDVDGTDFLVWQRGFGSIYDSTDLANWQTNFGVPGQVVVAAAVPEPGCLLLVLMLGLIPTRMRRPS